MKTATGAALNTQRAPRKPRVEMALCDRLKLAWPELRSIANPADEQDLPTLGPTF
ncbi:MAG: hypothetical protein KGI46_05270 [Alphaproteobacteria bacterium]|nr:hypothetical protein [Alphaproteobacteria bacterium]